MGVGAAVGIGVGIIGAKKQRDSGKSADSLAGKNADLIREETATDAANLERAQEQTLGMTAATQSGSGIRSAGGTVNDYLAEMKKTFASDLDNLKKSGESRAKITREGGSVAKDQASANAWGTLASATTGAISVWK